MLFGLFLVIYTHHNFEVFEFASELDQLVLVELLLQNFCPFQTALRSRSEFLFITKRTLNFNFCRTLLFLIILQILKTPFYLSTQVIESFKHLLKTHFMVVELDSSWHQTLLRLLSL